MVDSQTKSGSQTIGKLNREALIELYSTEDIQQDYAFVRSAMNDPDISTKDKVALLRLVWEYTMEKPKTTSEVKLDSGFSRLSNEELKNILKEYKQNGSKTE